MPKERRMQLMLANREVGGACPDCLISQGVNLFTKETTPSQIISNQRYYRMSSLTPDVYVLDFGETYSSVSQTCEIKINNNIIFRMKLDGSYSSDLIDVQSVQSQYPDFDTFDLPRKFYFDMFDTQPLWYLYTRGGKYYMDGSMEVLYNMDLFSDDVEIVLTNIYENNKFPDFRVYLDSYENQSNWG